MDTKAFWENRLSKGVNLRATGHRAFSLEYNRWLYQAQVDALDLLLVKNQVPVMGASLLDVGSGGGFFIDYFLSRGVSQVVGVDIARPSVDLLRNRFPEHRFYHLDIAEEDHVLEDCFDLITAISVMFHIVDDVKFERALTRMCALLKPGGHLILCDTFEKPLLPQPGHVRMRALPDYQAVFQRQGLKVTELLPMYYLLNRVYIPWIGPRLISLLRLGKVFRSVDKRLRSQGSGNWGGMKLLLARKQGA